MSGAVTVDPRFHTGDVVEAFDVHGRTWRRAVLGEHAPYPKGRTDGYYVTWEAALAPGFPSWQSAGGWVPTHSLRVIETIAPEYAATWPLDPRD